MGCTILITDADTLQGGDIADELKFHGYQVATTAEVLGVLNLARCLAPDLIILDLMYPEMDGLPSIPSQIRKVNWLSALCGLT